MIEDLKKEKAFTLAEILITIGIIGVVAAFTLPTLINKHKAVELKNSLYKEYSILSQAITNMITNTGYETFTSNNNIEDAENFMNLLMQEYAKPYYNCYSDKEAKFCIGGELNREDGTWLTTLYKNFTGNKSNESYINDGRYMLKNGACIFLDMSSPNKNYLLSIDVNGMRKKPNKFGHDLFMFELNKENGKLIPEGAPNTILEDETEYCSEKSTSTYNGLGCTAKALRDPDYFNKIIK